MLLFIEFLVAKELIAVSIFGSIIQGTSAAISAGGPEGSLIWPLLTALVINLVGVSAIRALGFEDIEIITRFTNVQAMRFGFCRFNCWFLCLCLIFYLVLHGSSKCFRWPGKL